MVKIITLFIAVICFASSLEALALERSDGWWFIAPWGECYPGYDPDVFRDEYKCRVESVVLMEGGEGKIVIYNCPEPGRREIAFADTLHACQVGVKAYNKKK